MKSLFPAMVVVVVFSGSAFGGFFDALNKVREVAGAIDNAAAVLSQPVQTQQPVVVPQPVQTVQPVQMVQPVQAVQPVMEVQPVAAPQPAPAPQPVQPVAALPSVPAPDAAQVAQFAAMRTSSAEAAEPEAEGGTVKFTAPATPEQIAAAKAKLGKSDPVRLSFYDGDTETFAAACAAFPEAESLYVDECQNIKSIAAAAVLRKLRTASVKNMESLDIAPLSGLPELESVDLGYSKVDDLSPLATLPRLKDVDFYGSKLKSFAPLASCPSLRKVYFYAAELPEDGYASLGQLKQVKQFHGGLTEMKSIAWLAEVPQAEELKIFSEKIGDLSPIAGATNLRYLRIWNFDGGDMAPEIGDLSLVSGLVNLEKLELPGSSYSNLAALGGLVKVRKLDLSGAKKDIDLSFARAMADLEDLSLEKSEVNVSNLDALAGCAKLKRLNLVGVKCACPLAPLAQCQSLERVTVTKGAFQAADVAALNAAMQARSSYFKVEER